VTGNAESPDVGARGWTTRDGLTRLIARSDRLELEQATLRVVIAGLALVYVAWFVSRRGDNVPQAHVEGLTVALGFFLLSCLLVLRVLAAGKPSVLRRFFGMTIDNAVITYCMIRMGEPGASMLGVYLFITFGYGFRYGRLYMHACQLMAIVGFALVLAETPYWSYNRAAGLGFLLVLIILPAYVGVLLQRILETKKRTTSK
jgi:two-component system sensor histidine kinase RpfC